MAAIAPRGSLASLTKTEAVTTMGVLETLLALVWPFVAGLSLGLFFFGVMWLTIARLADSRAPGLLLAISFLGRLAITMAGFFYVARADGRRLLACLAGFIIARVAMVGRMRPKRGDRTSGSRLTK
jgi:F1F0 ATPase subunit 2